MQQSQVQNSLMDSIVNRRIISLKKIVTLVSQPCKYKSYFFIKIVTLVSQPQGMHYALLIIAWQQFL